MALEQIKAIAMEPEVGAIYEGKVVKITDFGAFVQLAPGTDGLVHISQLANHRVTKVTDVVNEGDIIRVKVLEISQDGKIRLSLKAALEEEKKDRCQRKPACLTGSESSPKDAPCALGIHGGMGECRGPGRIRTRAGSPISSST